MSKFKAEFADGDIVIETWGRQQAEAVASRIARLDQRQLENVRPTSPLAPADVRYIGSWT